VLFASFVIGICIREVRFQLAKVESTTAIEPETSSDRMARMGERFEGMSEEEREKAIAQMRERFGGRRREGRMRGRLENMSEEERAKMREEMEKLRERWEEMSEEEREDAREQMQERYGFVPRIGIGGRPGGGEGGRRRSGGIRQENN
jgi:DNA anti-recombination protein RmuC